MKPLKIEKLPLEGTVCIEASAGTGKTFTIGLIVLRLVMEQDLDLRRLVVVTFTEAATGELADRIAEFLRIARDYAASAAPDDKHQEILALVDSAKRMSGDRVLERLDDALLNLDLAHITTIHGFCARILDEYAFETRSGFGMEVIKSQQKLAMQILADFWRLEIATLGTEVGRFLNPMTPESLWKDLKSFLAFPGLVVEGPQIESGTLEEFSAEYDRIRNLWNVSRNEILEILTEDPQRFNQTKLKVGRIPGYAEKLDDLFSAARVDRDTMVKFSHRNLQSSLSKKSNFAIPPIPYLSEIEPFVDSFESVPGSLEASITFKAYKYLIKELQVRQQSLRVRSFDTMISDLAGALKRDGESLASLIRRGFSAVLVDEFQDTDPLQYEIFYQLFSSREDIFFAMIGDPKQAIYRFRGGDINTYLRARNSVSGEQCYTINNNYRSESRLVEAINRIYAIDNPAFEQQGAFLVSGIQYVQVNAKRELLPPEHGGTDVPPIILWDTPDGDTPDVKIIGRRIADTISRFMDPGKPLVLGPSGDRKPLRLGEVAVLVNSHRTAQVFKRILAGSGIRSVVCKSGSVCLSDEANDLMLLLETILNPSKERIVRALLTSSFYAYDLDALTVWESNDTDRIAVLDELNDARTRWINKGIAAALNHLFNNRGVFAVAAEPELELLRERRITNLRHLIEILHTEEMRVGRNPELLVSSFRGMLSEAVDNESAEEMEQRLESDSEAVQIITMHKAKGLQWPVVFAPELWRDGIYSGMPVAPIVSDDKGRRADLDPSRYDDIESRVRQEIRQERMRIAYVTLTRAESLLVAVTANVSRAAKDRKPAVPDLSPSALLLRSPELRTLEDDRGPLVRSEVLALDHEPRKFEVRTVRQKERPLRRWDTSRRLYTRWSIGSYSGLTEGMASGRGPVEPDPAPPEGIFAFPRGTDAGTAIHSIFERIDFETLRHTGDPPPADLAQLVAGILTDAGFSAKREPKWVEYVTGMVTQVMQAPLPAVGRGFRLADLDRESRLAELEFHLTAAHPDHGKKPVTEESLIAVLGPDVGRIARGKRLAGFLNGFIDLVFRQNGKWWILDWKSNHLGNSAGRYGREALELAMKEHNYHLQYLLYTVALTRYLSVAAGGSFDYDRDFGGVLYLFVRGVDASGNGAYSARPTKDVISRLGDML